MDFAVPADHRIKLKGSEKKDKYFDLAREMKNLWIMKVKIIPVVICILGTATKGLVQGMEDIEITKRVKTLQTIKLLRSARILQRFLETWGDFLSLKIPMRSKRWWEKTLKEQSNDINRTFKNSDREF